MQKIWESHPVIAERVKKDHAKVGLSGGHDYVHAFRVGETARKIALSEWDTEFLANCAGVAGLAHNADRILQKEWSVGRKDIDPEAVRALIRNWISDQFVAGACDTITEAVIRHEAHNQEDDSKVQIALMDADRVVNLDTDLFPRSGQHYADLPVVDYEHFLDDPEATYRNPKTILRDIRYSLDWIDPNSPVCVRTNLGKTMAESRANVFSTFFDALRSQLAEEGIDIPFKG